MSRFLYKEKQNMRSLHTNIFSNILQNLRIIIIEKEAKYEINIELHKIFPSLLFLFWYTILLMVVWHNKKHSKFIKLIGKVAYNFYCLFELLVFNVPNLTFVIVATTISGLEFLQITLLVKVVKLLTLDLYIG